MNDKKLPENNFISKTFDELSTRELYEILKIRNEVFMLEQRITHNDVDGKDLFCEHIYLENANGEIIAYARAIPKSVAGKYPSFGRVCVRREYRGHGLAKKLVAEVIKVIEEKFGEKEILIDAQAYLEKFYSEFGFKSVSEVFSIGGIDHINMLLEELN